MWTTHPRARWAVPVVATAVCIGAGVLASGPAQADTALPPRTAEQLLVDVQQAKVDGMSGTISESADLGLPQLPGNLTAGGTSLASLVSGTHTLRVWQRGDTMSRVALPNGASETDVIRKGTDVWMWNSADQSVTHDTLTAEKGANQKASQTPPTPQEIAKKLVDEGSKTTTIATSANDKVAGRDAYELVLTPKDSASRVATVHIAIDGITHVPLRVQVYSTKLPNKPAVEVGFTSVSFAVPDASVFAFSPPKGAKVTQAKHDSTHQQPTADQKKAAEQAKAAAKTVGTGWTTIQTGTIDLTALKASASNQSSANKHSTDGTDPQALLALLPKVSGSWGSGHVLDGTLVSFVLTDDGRYAVGAVSPDALCKALPAA